MNQQLVQEPADRTSGGPDRPASTVGDSTRRTVEAVRETGETLLGHAQDLAGTAAGQASDQVEQGKEQVAERLAGVAARVQATARDLKGDEAWLADLLDRGAGQIAALADSLKENDMRSLVGSVERFARAQPGLFAGAAVAVGFAAARVAMAPAKVARPEPTAPPQAAEGPATSPSPMAGRSDLYTGTPGDEPPPTPGREDIFGSCAVDRTLGEEAR